MKFLLLLPIRLYWTVIPPSKRRCCIHRVSCSRFVYDATNTRGLMCGIIALRDRMKTCRGGYEMAELNGTVFLFTRNGTTLEPEEISEHLRQQFYAGLQVKDTVTTSSSLS